MKKQRSPADFHEVVSVSFWLRFQQEKGNYPPKGGPPAFNDERLRHTSCVGRIAPPKILVVVEPSDGVGEFIDKRWNNLAVTARYDEVGQAANIGYDDRLAHIHRLNT